MTLRARIFIIVSIIVLFILGVSVFLIYWYKNKTTGGGTAATTTQANLPGQNGQAVQGQTATQIPAGLPVKKQTTLEVEKAGVKQIARAFTERYGTYSSDNSSQNIREVETLCTADLWRILSARIVASSGQVFVGVTTKAITADITSWDDNKAVINIRTMRTENNNGTITNKYQNADVTMVKNGENWLVDNFVWAK